MKNLLIQFDDPMERLLYGEPDEWLALHVCRHDWFNERFVRDENGQITGTERVPIAHEHGETTGDPSDQGYGERITYTDENGEERYTVRYLNPANFNPDHFSSDEWRDLQDEYAAYYERAHGTRPDDAESGTANQTRTAPPELDAETTAAEHAYLDARGEFREADAELTDADAAATAAEQAYIDARDGDADAETVARLRQEAVAAQQAFSKALKAAEDARNLVKSLHAQFALASGLEVSAADATHAITHAQEAVNAAENALAEAGADATAAEQAYIDARDGDADADTVARLRQEAIAAQQTFGDVREAALETRELSGSIISQMAGRLTREQVREALTGAEHTPLSVINSVLSGPVTAEGIALLQSYAANEAVAGQTITLTNADGSTTQTTIGDYLNNHVLPSHRAQHGVIHGDPERDKEILDSLAKDTAAAKETLDQAQAAHDANPTTDNRAALDAAQRAYDIAKGVEDSARAVEHNTNLAVSLGLPATATGSEINAEIDRLNQPGAEPRPGSDAAATQSYLTKIDELRTQPTSNENYNRLGYLSNDPAAHKLTVTWDGQEMSLADYIRDVVQPHYWDRLRIHTSNDESDEQFINELATETGNAKQALDDAINAHNGDPINEELKAAVDAARAAYQAAYDRERRVRNIDRNSDLAESLGLPPTATADEINRAIEHENAASLSEFAVTLGLPADATREQVDAEVNRLNAGGDPLPNSQAGQELSEFAVGLGLPADATREQVNAEVNRRNQGGEALPTASLVPEVAASMGLPPGATVADAKAKIHADTENVSAIIAFADALNNSDLVQDQRANDSKVRGRHVDTQNQAIADIPRLKQEHPELAGAFQLIEDRVGTSGLPRPLRDGIAHLGRTGTFSEEALQELFAGYDAARSDASAAMAEHGDDTSEIRFNGRTGQFTFTTNNDDDRGSGGVASPRAIEYTVHDDGAVSYMDPDNGLTYRVNDPDLADAVRSGTPSLSGVWSISDSGGIATAYIHRASAGEYAIEMALGPESAQSSGAFSATLETQPALDGCEVSLGTLSSEQLQVYGKYDPSCGAQRDYFFYLEYQATVSISASAVGFTPRSRCGRARRRTRPRRRRPRAPTPRTFSSR